nr:hypothetical protein HUO10_003532 [Paraburkholderia busanensis]
MIRNSIRGNRLVRVYWEGVVYLEGAVRVSRNGADVGRAYLELTGYAERLRIGGLGP